MALTTRVYVEEPPPVVDEAPKMIMAWADGQSVDPQLLADKKIRVQVGCVLPSKNFCAAVSVSFVLRCAGVGLR